jgi:dienelactone hydrolase
MNSTPSNQFGRFSRTPRRTLRELNLSLLAVFFAAQVSPLWAQHRETAPRADGKETPLMVYDAVGAPGGCAPLAIISHGAGGSEDGYHYLAEAMAENGFAAIVMGHRESGGSALRHDVLTHGVIRGIKALVTDPDAESDRLLDVGAALKWSDGICSAPFRVLLGHSMGAETVMFEAGAGNMIGVKSPPAGQDRFDTYVALSPEGPGVVFPEHAWEGIHKPMLVLTGTRDQSLKGGAAARQIPWHDLPGNGSKKCQWMGVIEGATHMNFAGAGFGARGVDQKVTAVILDFLQGVRGGACKLPPPVEGMKLQAK